MISQVTRYIHAGGDDDVVDTIRGHALSNIVRLKVMKCEENNKPSPSSHNNITRLIIQNFIALLQRTRFLMSVALLR